MAKKQEKTVLKKMSFKDLVKFKKRKDIKVNGEVIFYLEEPSNEKLVEFIQSLIFNREDKEESTFNFKGKDIAWIFRQIVKGDIEIESLTDEEIAQTIADLGSEIKEQIEDGLQELVTTPMQNYITKLNERFEALMGDVKELEKNAKTESEPTNQES